MKPLINEEELKEYRFPNLEALADWCFDIYNSDTTSPMFNLESAYKLDSKAFPKFVVSSSSIESLPSFYGEEIGGSYSIFVTHDDLDWVLIKSKDSNKCVVEVV